MIGFLNHCDSLITNQNFKEKEVVRTIKYDLVAHEENYQATGYTYVKLRVKNTCTIFYKPVHEFYKKEWLDSMSGEDGAFIAILFISEKQKNQN